MSKKTKKRDPEVWNAYQREYRRQNPEKVAKWRHDYLIRLAKRTLAEEAQLQRQQCQGDNKAGETHA